MTKQRSDAMGDLAALERAIAASPYDALVAVSPENVRYVGDVHIDTQRRIRDRLAFIIWPKHGQPVFLVCEMEASYVRANSWITEVRTYQEFVEDPMAVLAGILRELKADAGQVAVETAYLAARYCDELKRQCPQLAISPAEPLLAKVRMFKTPREKAQIIMPSPPPRSASRNATWPYGWPRPSWPKART